MAKLLGLREMKKELEKLKGEKYKVLINGSIISSGYVDEVELKDGKLTIKSRTGNEEPFTEERVCYVRLEDDEFKVVYDDFSKIIFKVYVETEEDKTDAFIERKNEEIWELVDREAHKYYDGGNYDPNLINPEDIDLYDYASNAPCDNSGYCIGMSCPHFGSGC